MENTTSNRIHPLMAAASASLILVSLVGAAAIAGLLPNSHGQTVANPTTEMMNNTSTPMVRQSVSAPAEHEIIRYKTVVHHEYPRDSQTYYNSDHAQLAQAEQARDYRPAPTYQQPAQVAQNSPLGIGLGALVGGLVGSQVGGGNGRTLAAIAGAVGGGYVGNEIAKRNQTGAHQ